MTDLPDVRPVNSSALVTDDQVRAVLVGLEPGWYVARDLYPRYLAYAEREGLAPGSRAALGNALRRVTPPSDRFAHGHSRLYQVTEELTRS